MQREIPLAVVQGEEFTEFPQDLYIPPEALEVFLELFTGPLDLLLYLIRRWKLDIRDVSVEQVTEQYLKFIATMEELRLEVAAEYLVMAATLAEIKSRRMLPQLEEEEEEDPYAWVVEELKRHQREMEFQPIREAARRIGELPRMERDAFSFRVHTEHLSLPRPQPKVTVQDLVLALQNMAKRIEFNVSHHIEIESLSVQERMGEMLERLEQNGRCSFSRLYRPSEGRLGIAVTFLALLELLKVELVDCSQEGSGAPIHIWRMGMEGKEVTHA